MKDILAGKELVPLFAESNRAPSVVYWGLKDFLEHPDDVLIRKVVAKFKVSPQYLIDRVEQIISQIDQFRETNPYSILDLTYEADLSEIENQWKRIVKKWHPDGKKERGWHDSLVMTQKVNEAYEILKSPHSRLAYNQTYIPLLAIVKDIEDHSRDD